MTPMSRVRALTASVIVAAIAVSAAAATDYRDARGDTRPAPDIVGVRVTNDDAGRITFRVLLTSPLGAKAGRIVGISVDGDRDETTGDDAGFDVTMSVDGRDVTFSRWKNGKLQSAARLRGSRVTTPGNTVIWTVPVAELGAETSFEFAAWTRYYHGAIELDGDDAPAGTAWAYELTT